MQLLSMQTLSLATWALRRLWFRGGGEIYAATLSRATRIYLTQVHGAPEGDTRFPDFDRSTWHEVRNVRQPRGDNDSDDYSLIVLERV